MPVLDRYVEAMIKHRAEQLVFRSGAAIDLVIGGAARPISSRPATENQIAMVLTEALGASYTPGVGGARSYPYEAPSGAVTVLVDAGPQGLVVRVQPARGGNGSASGNGGGNGNGASHAPASFPAPGGTMVGIGTVAIGSIVRKPASKGDSGEVRITPAVEEAPRTPAPAPRTPEPISIGPGAPAADQAPGHIDELFHQMLEMRASDMHLKANATPKVRVDGSITPMPGRPVLTNDELEALLLPITPERNRDEFRETNDTDFAYALPGKARMRCNVFRDIAGVGAVFRQIPSKILTAQQLNLPRAVLDMCELDKGLVVVTGPTGSGKSTTLAAMIDWINTNRDDHIITIEDPVEFVHPDKKCLINQREVGTQTRSFKAALRAALREDPDIVLVGEMRDLETVAIAIETAETGHLVFGTLHTNTAPSTIDRLIDQFPADRQAQVRVMLAESLKGVVAQTLLKKKGGGRVAALEILIVTPAVSNLIREGKTFQVPSLMQTGKNLGMQTLNDALLELIKNDVVDPEEAFARAPHKKEFASLLTRAGHKGSWTENPPL